MESILARALEYTLKYWLKSFSRDQFKLQGRTAQLSNLDINGDSVHASMGLPPGLHVTTARVGKLEITLPSVSNVQVEPIVVQIDKLDLVLEEIVEDDNSKSPKSAQSAVASSKGSGYGFADKIADGMTLEVGTVNLMIETRGGGRRQGGATWSSPLASITFRNLLLYTTNENWQVVSLKEARDFSNNKNYIYVFKKLEWDSLSVDLLPHPDMFTDDSQKNKIDDDGAKRVFFGGERFLEGISGQAYITVQRTEFNSPLGLEVKLHIPEAVCPSLSEPGLRALLRFMTGFYVCLNRGDVDPKVRQLSAEAAGRSLVSVIVDHIFLCIKDADFQLELLTQSLSFSRASVSDGGSTKTLSRISIGGLFLRDTFSHPPCTLIQPSMRTSTQQPMRVPGFCHHFCPPIYPLEEQKGNFETGVPLIYLYSLQITPSPTPPKFASETIVNCQPLTITLQEETCLRISSFLADGIVGGAGELLPDFSVNSFEFTLEEFDLTIPLDSEKNNRSESGRPYLNSSFSGARLHVEDLYFCQSPSLKCTLLNLEKDPACFSLWDYQPIDASQKKWTVRASHVSLSLETSDKLKEMHSADWYAGLWRCCELHEACFEAAMVTADGRPLIEVPPPEGVVRIGIACQQYVSNTSVEQLFFVLDLYAYFGEVSERITKAGKGKVEKANNETIENKILKKMPSDTAVSLTLSSLHLKFLESSSEDIQGLPLVQFSGQDLYLKVSHRTLGGAFAVSTNLQWETVSVYCLDELEILSSGNAAETTSEPALLVNGSRHPQMRAVFWIENQSIRQKKHVPFLDMSAVHVMPFDVQDKESHSLTVSVIIAGVRLGGGMNYTESLLHRFGILGPDGGPGEGLLKGLNNLTSGPLAKLFKASPLVEAGKEERRKVKNEDHGGFLKLGMPDDFDVSVALNNWLFALEGVDEMDEGLLPHSDDVSREERSWHTTFLSLQVKAKSDLESRGKDKKNQKFPVEAITVGIEGLQALKPRLTSAIARQYSNVAKRTGENLNSLSSDANNGLDVEVRCVVSEDGEDPIPKWIVENVKFSVKKPIEAVATKEELEHLVLLCRSEVDSMGRIAAGMLKLFKLDKSFGQGAIDQLSNLGSGSIDKILTPDKLSRRNSIASASFTPRSSIAIMEIPNETLESTIVSLEQEISDSQAKCSALISELESLEASQQASDVKHLSQKLESMQNLLSKLRNFV